MPRVVHFEIAANDPEKRLAFYQNVFGWEIRHWAGPQDYWLIKTGEKDQPGIDGGFYKPHGPFTGTVNTIQVEDLDAYLEKVKGNGGQVVVEKDAVPGVDWLAFCKGLEASSSACTRPTRRPA